MLVHTVFFWLDTKLTEKEILELKAGLESLRGIGVVKGLFIGTPCATNRPVIDRSYSVGLTVIFNSMAEHEAYQIDPLHLKFVEEHSSKWTAVKIYDFE
jgi:hypothetical protein